MICNTTFDALFDGYLHAAATTPHEMSGRELLAKAGITSRQLSYFVKSGAVSMPLGRTRAAKYTADHLAQVRRVLALSKKGMTVAEIALEHASVRRVNNKSKVEIAGKTANSTRRATIYHLTHGITVIADEALLPSERKVLERVLKAGASTVQERRRMVSEVIAEERLSAPHKR